MSGLASFFADVTVGPAASAGDLTVFPLVSSAPREPRYETLANAVAGGRARVTETSTAGSVPDLRVLNDGDLPVLIVDGEELVGAKQNRIVNLTILVPAKSSLTIPVSCVEAGRWRSRSAELSPSGRAFHASGRRDKASHVNASLRTSGSRRSDQGAIWAEIREKSGRLHAESDSGAASAMFEQHAEALDGFVQALQPVIGQVGAIFVIRGRISGLDAFDSPATWARLMPTVVRSYGLRLPGHGYRWQGRGRIRPAAIPRLPPHGATAVVPGGWSGPRPPLRRRRHRRRRARIRRWGGTRRGVLQEGLMVAG